MWIETYDLEKTFHPTLRPRGGTIRGKARLTADISEILPYLNANSAGAVYPKPQH